MKKYLFILTFVSLVVSAQLADSVKWELSYKNSIVNGGFEQGKNGFSATGNTTFRQITTSTLVGTGKASGYADFTATSEKLRSDLATVHNSLKNRTCFARFIYNGGGTASVRYWVENQSGTVVAGYGFGGSTAEVISSAATNWTDSIDMNFTCPTSGSLRIVLEAQGDAAALYVDDLYIGRPFTYTATNALGGSGNDFTYGDGAATNKRLTWNRGGSNPQVRWNESTSKLESSNDGVVYSQVANPSTESTGLERVERVNVSTVCVSSPCLVLAQSGPWLDQVQRIGTGSYRLLFAAGMFSYPAVCVGLGDSTGGNRRILNAINGSDLLWDFETRNSAGTLADAAFNIICMGPK